MTNHPGREREHPEGVCRNHGLKICSRCVTVTDAAKRMSDQINARITFAADAFQLAQCYMMFKLDDGSTDGTLYDTKRDAVKHCPDERWYAFFSFRNAMGGVNPHDCQIFLDLHRHAYENGGRLADPDDSRGGPNMIMSQRGYDFMSGRRSV